VAARSEPVGVDGHVVGTLRVSVGIARAWLICGECAVREAVVATVDLPLEARLETRPAGGILSGLVLHAEKMRGQAQAVPRVLR
jgi:hypothetical protein